MPHTSNPDVHPRISKRLAGAACFALLAGVSLSATGAATAAQGPSTHTASSSSATAAANPYAPDYQHPYRHGALPGRTQLKNMKAYAAAHHGSQAATTAAAATGPETLSYGGGTNGVGVMDTTPHVYLVFYGTQWGTESTSNGIDSFTGDPDNAAPAAQKMFAGVGTNNELWSGTITQYCDGPNVAANATSCPSNAAFVPYTKNGILSGVWYDNSGASPSGATGNQLGQEAVKAAGHFGNTTAAANRSAYYVILSPHGTDPDNYESPTQGYCAWHDWTGDSSLTGGAVSSSYGPLAFSNQPYNVDQGSNCGVNFLSSSGTLDGWTMTLGHEYSEMMTDQFPSSGWTNQTGDATYNGQENADECAWLSAGTQGAPAYITMGTGTFAEQGSWSNDDNRCDLTHAIVTGSGGGTGGNTVTVTNPGSETGKVGTAASVQISASDSASGQTLTYSVTGLPVGLSINSSTGLISGTPSTAGTSNVTVTVKDTTGATGTTSFSWTISAGSTGCTAAQLLGNPGFETGSAAPWTSTSGVINPGGSEPAHSGSYMAWLDGYGTAHTDTLAQSVSIPSNCANATFSYWWYIDTQEATSTNADDTLTVQVLNSSGTVLQTLHTYSNLDADNTYTQASFSLNSYIGQTVTLKFTGTETDADGGTTDFLLDDTALNVS